MHVIAHKLAHVRTCAHTKMCTHINSLRIHNVSAANFGKYGYVAKTHRGKLKNFVEYFAF